MDEIYDEMYTRNTAWLQKNSVISDTLLLTPHLDNRKCIALVAQDNIELLNMEDINKICDSVNNKWMTPKVHSTFLVLRGWSTDSFHQEDWTPIKNIIKNNLSSYEIIFDRVIPVKTGLVLCGTPFIDINSIRDKIRDAGYETNVLYKCDIVHTTILRWTSDLNHEEQKEWLEKIMALERKPYARITVTGFDIILASWSMYPDTVEILDSFNI